MQTAAQRLSDVFKGDQAALRSWLDLVLLNAKTTLAMLFQDPSTSDPKQAAYAAAATLLENAGQLSKEAGLNSEEAEKFAAVHKQAIDEFNRALELALNRGAKDRPAQAFLIAQILRLPLGPLENVDEETWLDRLDEVDAAAKKRRERTPEPNAPNGKDRDQIAEWIIKKHFTADSAIREIWYLKAAPPTEICLLEVNDRLTKWNGKIEAIDFGLNIEGVSFRLFVADITSEQLEAIKNKKVALPSGWAIDNAQVSRRGR